MGSHQSYFEKTKEQSKVALSPSNIDFITGHADLTGLAVVEVQRLWGRFQQLGVDKNGNLPKKSLEKGELAQDPFIKNTLSSLPKERDGSLSFIVFLNFNQWLESSDEDSKLRGLFHILNDGNSLDADVIRKLLRKVYSSSNEDQIKLSTDILMSQIDPNNTGRVNENQFVSNIRKNYTDNQLIKFLKFDLIPPEVLDEANMQSSMDGSRLNVNKNAASELDDETLAKVAKKAVKKDWEKLCYKLGFLESDIAAVRERHDDDEYETLVELLIEWRKQDPYAATKTRLQRYLEDSKMRDAAALLD